MINKHGEDRATYLEISGHEVFAADKEILGFIHCEPVTGTWKIVVLNLRLLPEEVNQGE